MRRYIKRVEIDGFQSHRYTALDLTQGVVAITGPSDNGKSAVLRALRWVLYNEAPECGVDKAMHKGCTRMTVKVIMSDGVSVLRERDGKRNRYVIERPGEQTLTLVDFGRDVPAEVIEAHGMRQVPFDPRHPTALSYASQLEAPFFLTNSAPDRARILGRLAGVHYVDLAQKTTNADALALSKEIKSLEGQVAQVEAELAAYDDLDSQEQCVTRAEQLLRDVQPITTQIERLQSLVTTNRAIQAAIEETSDTLIRLQVVEDAGRTLMEAENAHLRLRPLVTTRTTWQQVKRDQDATGATLLRLQGLSEAITLVNEAESAHQHVHPLAALRSTWVTVQSGIAVAQQTLQRLDRVGDAVQATTDAERTDRTIRELVRIVEARNRVRKEWGPTKAILARTTGAEMANSVIAEAAETQSLLERLTSLHATQCRIATDMMNAKVSLDRTARQVEASTALETVAATQERINLLIKLNAQHVANVQTQVQGQAYLQSLEQRIAQAAEEYGGALRETGICPTCLQVISPEAAQQIAAGIIHEEGHRHVS